MRSPRVVYGLVAAMLAVAGFVLPRYLADRSVPDLGDTVVIPAGSSASVPPGGPPTAGPPTAGPTTVDPTLPGADPVSPRPARTAGDDDRDDADDLDDLDDDD
ncbi:hypothetical protein [Kribbella sp. CA-293567]|uniref:hypothetical protein n=1 Tax=Kribbella sp. CA-293567 TaxID=3002436 RepID=UPI0022DD9DFB|nr:hypothetical protein [Kribbella sp. CA-293567]WBQ06579.1 hypothetical protein OX958_07225 [Kribbella sp. CA-293567]